MKSFFIKNLCTRFLILCAALLLALVQTGCATGYTGSVVSHGFEFDAVKDSPDVVVLAYRYGNSGAYWTSLQATEKDTKNGTTNQTQHISGPIQVGKDLYVKWRIKETGEVFEDTVNLQTAWTKSMEDQRLYFIIEGSQLYVYVISELAERPAFTFEQAFQIDQFNLGSPRKRAFSGRGWRYINMIYPEYQIDPHLPPELRRKK